MMIEEASLQAFAKSFADALEEYVKQNGTIGLCWFCKNQYKINCEGCNDA